MNVPLIIAGVVLWTLNILTSWSMISAGYPQFVVVTATLSLLFTLLVSRRRIARARRGSPQVAMAPARIS